MLQRGLNLVQSSLRSGAPEPGRAEQSWGPQGSLEPLQSFSHTAASVHMSLGQGSRGDRQNQAESRLRGGWARTHPSHL